MAFEMIEGLFTVQTTIHGFACRRAKLADQFCMIRIASRALNCFLLKHFRSTELLFGIRRSNAECF